MDFFDSRRWHPNTVRVYADWITRKLEDVGLLSREAGVSIRKKYAYSYPELWSTKALDWEDVNESYLQLVSYYRNSRKRYKRTWLRSLIVIGLLVYTGMRAGEVKSVVYCGDRKIRYYVQKKRSRYIAEIHVPGHLAELIEEYIAKYDKLELPSRSQVFRIVKNYFDIFYDDIYPHRLRHTLGTYLSRAHGIDTAAAVLNHSSVNITMRYVKKNVDIWK
ncbi:MAG: hypothetical protein KatS3mg083_137 [Candidatus Dojkabacteria bacterium]|nr:MAG: hypothetical protein KatS3mg083_137 [Candidatus Dojkabacteria bacterium]